MALWSQKLNRSTLILMIHGKVKSHNKNNSSSGDVNQNNMLKRSIVKKHSLNISNLSYEQSLEELDLIIKDLQDESILVEELNEKYIKANLYIKHCEQLLSRIEQEVIEMNLEDLKL